MDATTSPLSLLTLRELIVRQAEAHYRRRSGDPTGTHLNVRTAIDSFVRYAGEACPASRINRHMVRAWVDQLAADGTRTRVYVNDLLGRLRTSLKWAAAWDHIPPSVLVELQAVQPLRLFRTRARESVKRTPPTLADVVKVAKFMPPLACDILKLIKLTGARPSELLAAKNSEVSRRGRIGVIAPVQHKSAHFGHRREIPLNAAAMKIVAKWWVPLCPNAPLFPAKRKGSRRGHYSLRGFRATLKRACTRAGVRVFTPYEVRHAVARHVRRLRGLDAAQALLGHSKVQTTEIYAPLPAGDPRTAAAARRATEVL